MSQTILGLNAYHGDSSACLLRDGEVVAAVEEERFNRLKHWAGFPAQAIAYCLHEGQIALGDVDVVAINRNPKANVARKIAFSLRRRPSLKLVADRVSNARAWGSIGDEFTEAFGGETLNAEIVHIEHHLAHLASAHACAPFRDAVAVSIDGFGDFASAAWGMGSQSGVDVDERVYFPHSLGVLYQAITQFLGFPNFGDEYKVMGLAPYGEPTYADQVRRLVRTDGQGRFQLNLDYFRHHREDLGYTWRNVMPSSDALYAKDAIEGLLGPARTPDEPLDQRHRDLARSVQHVYEEVFFELLGALHARYGSDKLVVSGGCGANSVANGKIQLRTPFQEVYIPPSTGDAGGCIGAALVAYQRSAGRPSDFVMDHAYWGPGYGNGDIEGLISEQREALEAADCEIRHIPDLEELCAATADAMRNDGVVGWFRGRMEFGPRALGNRSIVCDPSNPRAKDILNAKIKRRESFRPFAPSVKRDAVAEWFESDDDVPFMSRVFKIRPEKRDAIPAVTHVDGTGRLQTVEPDSNPAYYALIDAMEQRSGVPMILNTSFNENEPIVCTPGQALDCFLRTDMDVIVLEDRFIARRRGGGEARPA